MHFAQPDNLYLLLLLVPMVLALAGYFWWKRRLQERIGHLELVQAMASRHSNRRQLARGVLVIVAAALLCVAAAQPQWGQDDRTIKRFGVDVVFALDLSNSMLAQDLPPSRLQAAKNEIDTTLTTLAGDRVGLVVFTAISFAQSPLTTDYGAIRFYLDKLQAGQMPVGGTSVGQAILDSVELLTGEKVNGDASDDESSSEDNDRDRAKNQVIVLMTDGEDHESSPMEAARIAREHGIRVVTVGLGSPDGSRIPIYGNNGELKGYKRDQQGELVYTKLDEKTLEKVAAQSGGTYLRYTGEHSVANGIKNYIERLEKSELETMLRKRYKDRFMYFLAPALVLLLLALFLGERRSGERRSGERESGERGNKKASSTMLILQLFGVLVVLVGAAGCDQAFRDTVEEVDQGNTLISQKKYDEALEKYQQAESKVPASPELHYDRGIALLGAGKFDEAREAFARTLETKDDQLRFDALFNLGLALAGQEKWKEAYETYKEALHVQLDTSLPINKRRIEQARHNLEVVFRKLFPPCSELEDELEENDEPEAASQLEGLKKEDLSLCGLDEDWFVIPATVGTSVSVEANFSVLRDEPDPEHVFLPRPQDLQLAVFDASGEEVLAVDQGATKAFTPGAEQASRSIEKFTVTPKMVSGGQGHLFLKISAGDQREFSYDVEVTAIPPCEALEDDFEQNDTADSARALDQPNNELHICSGDDDWYEVDLELGDTLFVDLKPGQDRERERAPNLSMEIVRKETGEAVAKGRADKPYVTAGVQNVMEPGTYLVRVFGKTGDEQGPYTLDLYKYAPCVVGDDRFEENDSAQQAATLEPNTNIHRYLRVCDGDRDFFRLPAPKDDPNAQKAPSQGAQQDDKKTQNKENEVAWGLRAVADQSTGQPEPSDDASQDDNVGPKLDLMSASGDQIIAEGVAPKTAQPQPAPGSAATGSAAADTNEDKAAVRGLDQVVRHDNKEKKDLLLRVQGAQTFYHLQQLNPQNQNPNDQKNDQKNQDDQKKKDDKKSDDQKNKDDQKKDDQKKDGEKKDEPKKNEQKKDDEKKDGEKKDDQQEKENKENARRPKPAEQDPKERRTEDILRALEETDNNFQMKKALEDMPKRYIEKDW